ncbi:MAG TPA: NAD-dependent epimerase/dehydratase family protein [Bryobacteraceae bacterium]|nr:NAD-dependent epimerase/dehydratase family protein [Bryobacteraceae bacterium]
MRVGVVGCGRVAEHHLKHIQSGGHALIAGLVDSDTESLRRLGSKYGVSNLHTSLEALLDSTQLDVVHICTPPFDHFSMAQTAIRRGVHVLVEKPIAFRAAEVAQLYEEANEHGVSLCPNFIQLFHPAMMRAIQVVSGGELGRVIHCACNYGFSADDPALREAVGLHWAYGLPGGILHNHLSHPLYLVLFWIGKPVRTVVIPKVYGTLPHRLPDHLEIALEGEQSVAHITLSMVDRPSDYSITIHCERGMVTANFRTMTVVIERHGVLPGAVERLTSGIRQAGQLSKQFVANTVDMLRGRLVPYQGLGNLIPQFYESIVQQTEPPVSSRLAIAVSEAEDAVLAETGRMDLPIVQRDLRSASDRCRIVVTGATGFLGREVVGHLIKRGYAVRALARPQSHTDALEQLGAELVYGDVRELASLRAAFEGASIVVHLAAGMRGSERFILESGVLGTANVAAAARDSGVRRVIYTSSVSVYDFAAVREGGVVTEESPLDVHGELRGTYSLAKCKAEQTALKERSSPQTPWTILRPAVIFGTGHSGASLVGSMLGPFLLCLGRGNKQMRLIHVKDVAEAIVTMCEDPLTAGQVYNVAHPDSLTVRQYIRACLRNKGTTKPRVVYIPSWLLACAAIGLRLLNRFVKKAPNISSARVIYNCRGVRVCSSAILRKTSWKPSDSLMAQLLASNRGPLPYCSPWETRNQEVLDSVESR